MYQTYDDLVYLVPPDQIYRGDHMYQNIMSKFTKTFRIEQTVLISNLFLSSVHCILDRLNTLSQLALEAGIANIAETSFLIQGKLSFVITAQYSSMLRVPFDNSGKIRLRLHTSSNKLSFKYYFWAKRHRRIFKIFVFN